MKEKFLPWFLLFCALGLSSTAAYYSVIGLSVVFSSVAVPVIIMGSFLEISKIAIATYLHDKWKQTYGILKIYMSIALITLSIITSLGIYGLLSTGFQGNISKLEISEKKIKNVEVKKKRFEEIKIELNKEKNTLDGDITKLRDGLSTNTTTQSVDVKTGQVITKANNANRKTFESQLKEAQTRRDDISKKIDGYNDSITKLDVDILNMESNELSGSELGVIKYVSEILNWDIKRTANFFILILIFVFDPLAITLVIATNQAFKSVRQKEGDHPTSTPQVTPQDEVDTDQVTINHRSSTDQPDIEYKTQEPIVVEKIVEVPVEVIKEIEKIIEVPVDRIVEVEKIVEIPVDRIVEKIVEVPIQVQPKLDDEILFDEDRFFKEEPKIKRLTYTKNV